MHQCAAAPACIDRNTWLSLFRDAPESLRCPVGMLPPAALIALLWWFGRQSSLYDPPGDRHGTLDRSKDALGELAFWHTGVTVVPLRAAHVTIACSTLGILALTAAGRLAAALPLGVLLAAALVVGLVIVCWPDGFVAPTPAPPPNPSWATAWPIRRVAAWASIVLLVAAAVVSSVLAPPPAVSQVPYLLPFAGFEATAR